MRRDPGPSVAASGSCGPGGTAGAGHDEELGSTGDSPGTRVVRLLAIQRQRRDQEWPACPWVFFDDEGEQVLDFRSEWRRACAAAGLVDPEGEPTVIFHDLRRSGVRNLVRAGVPEAVAMRISGHKTRSIFDRYNIVNDADLKDAARKLAEYTTDRQKRDQDAAKNRTIVAQGHPQGLQ